MIVFDEFNKARKSTMQSNAMIYGDYRIGSDPLSSFIGYQENKIQTKVTNKVNPLLAPTYHKSFVG